ncbi:hypothetical protein BHM03_00018885 [Ensete ventricosum]|nr:hypothetical protein BHM03_00018885 [Ensete ventricosum]
MLATLCSERSLLATRKADGSERLLWAMTKEDGSERSMLAALCSSDACCDRRDKGDLCWETYSGCITCVVEIKTKIDFPCRSNLCAKDWDPDEEDEGGQASSSLAVFAGYRYPASQSRHRGSVRGRPARGGTGPRLARKTLTRGQGCRLGITRGGITCGHDTRP